MNYAVPSNVIKGINSYSFTNNTPLTPLQSRAVAFSNMAHLSGQDGNSQLFLHPPNPLPPTHTANAISLPAGRQGGIRPNMPFSSTAQFNFAFITAYFPADLLLMPENATALGP